MVRNINACTSASGRALLILTTTCLASCATNIYPDFHKPVVCRNESPISSSVFLIGDAGEPQLPAADAADSGALIDPVLTALSDQVRKSAGKLGSDSTAVIVLGDNVYPAGMPPAGEKGHERAVRILEAQIAAIGEARGFFMLGNHDWDQSKDHGWKHARAQHDYLATRAPNISIHPPNICPGPDHVDFSEHLRIVFFDFWSAIYQINHPDGPLSHCTPKAGEGRLVQDIESQFRNTDGRRVLFAAHPPLITAGPHGGYFPWKEHLFPLRVFHPKLWIPLPIIGSIFPLARELGVTQVDLSHPRYRKYTLELMESTEPGVPALVAGGHEHSLQIHVGPMGIFHAVSGAGSTGKIDYVRDMNSELMAIAAPGFMRLDVHEDKRLRLTVTAIDDEGAQHRVFSSCIP
jgi:hypothetical protein